MTFPRLLGPGTSHDWRLRCDAVNLYYTLFGLTRPSCLPLPELGLVLNLKEKKAVLNPTIKPEMGLSSVVVDTPASIGIHGIGMSYSASVSWTNLDTLGSSTARYQRQLSLTNQDVLLCAFNGFSDVESVNVFTCLNPRLLMASLALQNST